MDIILDLHKYHLLFNALASLSSAFINFYYVWKHANGKKSLRLLSGVVMLYFTGIQVAAALGIIPYENYGADYLRPWMPVLYYIPVFDVIVDFKKKKNPSRKGE